MYHGSHGRVSILHTLTGTRSTSKPTTSDTSSHIGKPRRLDRGLWFPTAESWSVVSLTADVANGTPSKRRGRRTQ